MAIIQSKQELALIDARKNKNRIRKYRQVKVKDDGKNKKLDKILGGE